MIKKTPPMVKNIACLSVADLRGADPDADLSYADLCRVNLCRASLVSALLWNTPAASQPAPMEGRTND